MKISLFQLILVVFIATLFFCCAEGKSQLPEKLADNLGQTDSVVVRKLFVVKCAICHGEDGSLGYANSKDLRASILTRDEVFGQIKYGKGTMPRQEGILTDEEINALTDFTLNLRHK